jgi:hypothetical protein
MPLEKAVVKFSPPLDIHPQAEIFFTQYTEDKVFGASLNAYSSIHTWKTPSAANPPFSSSHFIRTFQYAIASVAAFPGTFHFVIMPVWTSIIHYIHNLHMHQTSHLLAHFPKHTLPFQPPFNIPRLRESNVTTWAFEIYLVASDQTLMGTPIQD